MLCMQRLIRAVRSLAQNVARRGGFEVHRVQNGPLSMQRALLHFSHRIPVSTVIDVGASNGCWTELALPCWPAASYLLIEAQRDPHEADLRRLRQRDPRIDYVIAAAGNRAGSIHFDASSPFAGRASETAGPGHDIVVPVTTLDDEVARRGLGGPFLLKLDTHGYEVPILDGAPRVLANTNLLVIEVYNFTLGDGALQFPDMCARLRTHGFRPVGIVDLMYRPKDGFLWQFDLFFARSDRPEFASDRYE